MPATEVLGQGFTEDIRPIKKNDCEKQNDENNRDNNGDK
jgi:hypothetical protein